MTSSPKRRGPTRLVLVAAVVACATLGLAPFSPRPHVVEKLGMLAAGELTRPIDMFDLAFHGAPWVFLIAVLFRLAVARRRSSG